MRKTLGADGSKPSKKKAAVRKARKARPSRPRLGKAKAPSHRKSRRNLTNKISPVPPKKRVDSDLARYLKAQRKAEDREGVTLRRAAATGDGDEVRRHFMGLKPEFG